jgi:hypothetical protein
MGDYAEIRVIEPEFPLSNVEHEGIKEKKERNNA